MRPALLSRTVTAFRIAERLFKHFPDAVQENCLALLANQLFWLFKHWTHGTRRTLEAIANLRWIHVELGDGAAEGIPVHAKLFGGFALVSAMSAKYFKNEALFELADGFVVSDPTGVHLADQAVQLAFHRSPLS
jgi:hypothetical protein